MYETILLPTDGSAASTAAAAHAGTMAQGFDATIHVLSVVDTRNRFESPSSGLAGEAWLSGERDRAQRAVTETVAVLPDVPVETAVREGIPETQINEYVDGAEIDAIVMGTHGRTGLDRYLIGSVAERIVRTAPVPVMTVRQPDD